MFKIRRFQPAFGVRSTQTLVKIYNIKATKVLQKNLMKTKFYKENSTGVALVGVGLNGYSLT